MVAVRLLLLLPAATLAEGAVETREELLKPHIVFMLADGDFSFRTHTKLPPMQCNSNTHFFC